MTHQERLDEIREDPATPVWVPPLLDALQDRDPVDVANTLEYLAKVFGDYCQELFGAVNAQHPLHGNDVLRRLVKADSENGLLVDRVPREIFRALMAYLDVMVRKVRLEGAGRSDMPSGMAIGLSGFTLGYDYRGAFGELPRP